MCCPVLYNTDRKHFICSHDDNDDYDDDGVGWVGGWVGAWFCMDGTLGPVQAQREENTREEKRREEKRSETEVPSKRNRSGIEAEAKLL